MYAIVIMECAFADFNMEYQAVSEGIERTRNKQWAVTYYLLLLLAAIIGFSSPINLARGCQGSGQVPNYSVPSILDMTALQIEISYGLFIEKRHKSPLYRHHLTERFREKHGNTGDRL